MNTPRYDNDFLPLSSLYYLIALKDLVIGIKTLSYLWNKILRLHFYAKNQS